jgi:hypothetical protein
MAMDVAALMVTPLEWARPSFTVDQVGERRESRRGDP